MSEAPDKENKTEEGTEKHVRDSVEKGKVPISREVHVLLDRLVELRVFIEQFKQFLKQTLSLCVLPVCGEAAFPVR